MPYTFPDFIKSSSASSLENIRVFLFQDSKPGLVVSKGRASDAGGGRGQRGGEWAREGGVRRRSLRSGARNTYAWKRFCSPNTELNKGGSTWGEGGRASECPSCGVQNADSSCRALALQAAEVRLDFQRRGASALVSKCVPVCLSGGRDKRGGPILTFPARSNHDRIRQEDLRRLISYLACIPR